GFAADADSPLAQVAAEIYRALAAALQQANAMDFDDLLLHPLTLFAQHPERLAYWRRRFDRVLVDEFQDTNVAQYQLVKSLAADERDEAQWLATELARLAADTDIPYEGMAILYRTNAQSRPLEEAFRFRGIPYRIVGAVSFYERREVKDLLAYLRIIANPADDEAFLRVVNVPRRGIGDASLQLLGQYGARWAHPLLLTARNAERIPELRPNVRDAL